MEGGGSARANSSIKGSKQGIADFNGYCMMMQILLYTLPRTWKYGEVWMNDFIVAVIGSAMIGPSNFYTYMSKFLLFSGI